MSFQCLDCGHKGKQLKQGRCPACGSALIKSLNKMEAEKTKETQPLRLFLMVILWGVLLYKGYTTFFYETLL